VRALFEERVGAVAVPEVVELERATARGLPVGDRVAIEKNLDRADIAGEVSGLLVGLGQGERRDPRVVLCGGR
jgi:hypothetical protein